MNVLADFHHADLWWSLHILFEKRLGWKLYRPYGMEWYDQGYFHLYGDLRKKDPNRTLAKQYLLDTIFDFDGERGCGRETYYGCQDFPRFRLLTLDRVKETPIDIIFCTVNENEPYFAKVREFWPKAKMVRQVGNHYDTNVDHGLYPNLMSSAIDPYTAFKGPNKILYRQEFSLDLFSYSPQLEGKKIYSFQNDLEGTEETWEGWLAMMHGLRDYEFRFYGVGNDGGKIYSKRQYVRKMAESSLIYQLKDWDGYGHVIHNAFLMGRPVITKRAYYQDKIAGPLFTDTNYIEFGDLDKIRSLDFDELQRMSLEAHNRFTQVVNFDYEFENVIKPFLEKLV